MGEPEHKGFLRLFFDLKILNTRVQGSTMKNKYGMLLRTDLIIAVTLLLLVSVIGKTEAADLSAEEMEIVWTESDGLRHEVFTSTYRTGAWQEPVQLTNDNANNLHPSIDAGSDGSKWAVWTAIDDGQFEIRYAVFENDEWSDVKTLPCGLAVNIKPSVIVDADNVPWVVWSANNNDDDDIYYTRFIDGEWTEEKRIHEDNSVPDVLPFIDVDDDGRVVATWERFVDGSYVEVQSVWDDGEWGEVSVIAEQEGEEETADEQQVTVPDFITDTSQVFLRATTPSEKE